jgi:hypothetical protein
VSGHQDCARHEETAGRIRPRADHCPPRTNAYIRIPLPRLCGAEMWQNETFCFSCLDRQPCGRLRPALQACRSVLIVITDILGPVTPWPYVGLIGASDGARQSSVFSERPAAGTQPFAWSRGKKLRERGGRELRSLVQLLLRLRNHVAEHCNRRNIRIFKRVGRAISPHCGSVERGSGRILLVVAINHKHIL